MKIREKRKNQLLKFLYLAFSEKGRPSSKRIFGGLIILTICVSTLYATYHYGITDRIKQLMEIEFIGGCSLLGLTSITDIWKRPKR